MQIARVFYRTRILWKLLHHQGACIYRFKPQVTSTNNVFAKRANCFQICFSTDAGAQQDLLDHVTFEKVCEETLESLTEYFEFIVEQADNLKTGDVSYSGGVLTVNLGQYGTYVINRQSPNRQIWLSSPFSGPKRYDFILGKNSWVYKHDGITLHQLLQEELSKIVDENVNFEKCTYSK